MGKVEIPAITLSFKNTKDDIELREWINSHSNKSGMIKDILRKAMQEEKEKQNFTFQRL